MVRSAEFVGPPERGQRRNSKKVQSIRTRIRITGGVDDGLERRACQIAFAEPLLDVTQ
jgi:hypothetical protein